MDAYEATKVVFSRIQGLDPDHAARIMGLLLIQDHEEKEMIRLAFGPEVLLQSVMAKARRELGLLPPSSPGSPPTAGHQSPFQLSRKNFGRGGAPSPLSVSSPSSWAHPPVFSRSNGVAEEMASPVNGGAGPAPFFPRAMDDFLPREMDNEKIEMEALEHIMRDARAEPIKLSYSILRSITENFSTEIGRGGFGVVYKGVLQDGDVAVKKLLNLHALPESQFLNEITCLKKAKHKNVVRILGYCSETQGELLEFNGKNVLAEAQQKFLCFEYVPNGNIKNYLQQEKPHGGDWPLRYTMIGGICQALHFLHGEHINHLDLKPENVMLDAHMEPKVTDFGLSRSFDQGQSKVITKNIVGTLRYIAPETIDHGEISYKSDMYALGVVIIELLTRTSMISLTDWDESLELFDCPRARMCAEIARNCIDVKRDNRPTINEVIKCMEEMESLIPKSVTMNQLVTTTAFTGTNLLDVYPLELRFLFEPGQDFMSCHLTITNKTDDLVLCMLVPKDNYRGCEPHEYNITAMSSSVATARLNAKEELPQNMVEWEILMFTIRCDGEQALKIPKFACNVEEDLSYDAAIKVRLEYLGGELHRAALTASIIVESEHLGGVHPLGQEETSMEIKSMDVHPMEPWVLLITGDKVYIWNWQSNEKVGQYNYHDQVVALSGELRGEYSVAKFVAREQWVVTGKSHGFITVHTCPKMDRVNEFQAHRDGVSSLTVNPTRPLLLSFSFPFSLKLWDWSSNWSCTTTFAVGGLPLENVMFNPKDTTTFSTCREDGSLQMWSIGRPNHIAAAPALEPWGCWGCGLFTYTGHRDFTAGIYYDGTISIRDLRRKKLVYTLHTSESDHVIAACHPTRPIFVTVSHSGCIRVWDSIAYRLKMAYDNLPECPIHLGFTSPERLVVGYKDGIRVINIDPK